MLNASNYTFSEKKYIAGPQITLLPLSSFLYNTDEEKTKINSWPGPMFL